MRMIAVNMGCRVDVVPCLFVVHGKAAVQVGRR